MMAVDSRQIHCTSSIVERKRENESERENERERESFNAAGMNLMDGR